MAVTATVLKKTNTQCIIKVVADAAGSATITNASLAVTDRSAIVNETVSTPKASIARIDFSTGASESITIDRVGTKVAIVKCSGEMGGDGYSFTDANDKDVTVTFSGTGTVVLTFTKDSGYKTGNQQNVNPLNPTY